MTTSLTARCNVSGIFKTTVLLKNKCSTPLKDIDVKWGLCES